MLCQVNSRRTSALNKLLTVLCVVSATMLLRGTSTHAQASATREELVHEIESLAEAHAKTNTPMKDDSVVERYRDNKVGLTAEEISTIYVRKYLEVREAKQHWWERLPWWLAWIVVAMLLLGKAFKDWIEEHAKKQYEEIYQRYAGSRLLRRNALKRYRDSIIEQHQKLKIPFRDTPLDMREVYVPLKIGSVNSVTPVEALEAARQYRVLVVTGNPGSGKSMLMRSLLLRYADGRMDGFGNDPIPVLLELSRLNDQSASVEQQLLAALARYGFPAAGPFLRHALKHRAILLLLDGLDEVNAKERPRAVQVVSDLIQEYRCGAIITCRTQVYRDEFSAVAEKTLEIAEFSDKDVLRLLKAWEQDMPPGRSVEYLMQVLHERPRILMLARNPLLLTMIAYLYVDAQIALPYSRAEFYEKTISLLLEKWQGPFNRFKGPAKAAVLSRLALRFQAKPTEDQERRSIPFQEILKLIQEILPSVNVKPEDAGDLLDEIVDRAGLILRIDGGSRFQFAHLTMQEYFAAVALEDDRASLLEHFRKDLDTWREVVKLWCGIVQDATEMIRDMQTVDEITALECLADARFVNPTTAGDAINKLRSSLGAATDTGLQEALAKAFGLLAASPGPRGEEILKWLAQQLHNENASRRVGAAKSLAYSYLDKAALLLAADGSAEAQAALETMGDLAVRPLVMGKKSASLIKIGTPRAIEGAASLLWDQDPATCVEAAWNLAAKFSDPQVEAALRTAPLPASAARLPVYDWIWEPFREDQGTSLPVICGRIGFLLSSANGSTTIDARIGLALFAETNDLKFLYLLPRRIYEELTENVRKLRSPTREDWLRVLRPEKYNFRDSGLFTVVRLFFTAFYLAGVVCMALDRSSGKLFGASTAGLLVIVVVQLIPVVFMWTEGGEIDLVRATALLGIPVVTYNLKFTKLGERLGGTVLGILIGVWVPIAIYFCSLELLRSWRFPAVVLLWSAVYCFGIVCYSVGYYLERRAKNPLQGLLESPAQTELVKRSKWWQRRVLGAYQDKLPSLVPTGKR